MCRGCRVLGFVCQETDVYGRNALPKKTQVEDRTHTFPTEGISSLSCRYTHYRFSLKEPPLKQHTTAPHHAVCFTSGNGAHPVQIYALLVFVLLSGQRGMSVRVVEP